MRVPRRLLLAGALLAAACGSPAPAVPKATPPPPLPDPATLPPLPAVSARNASYSIDATLDPDRHAITASEVLTWRNTSDRALSEFPFHLYWNAFRNNRSTSARGEGRRAAASEEADGREPWGFIQVKAVRLLDPDADLLPTLRYIQPDDTNADDRTVAQVTTPRPVAPGETVRFRIEWTARLPYGDTPRSGWVRDYVFVAQWFPKIGVFSKGAWNAHQFHANGEFFADYGVYDVRLTLPARLTVGATGRLAESRREGDLQVLRFVQEDVHDFAWAASPRFREHHARFEDPGYPPVGVRLLVMPEHEHLAARYLASAMAALRLGGSWAAPYPYPQLTIVDPAWNSGSGGMEYPTLITGGSRVVSPSSMQSPEIVTVHEVMHQFWYGLVGNNEFEEAWLDEGITQLYEGRALMAAYGPRAIGRRWLGGPGGEGGISVPVPGIRLDPITEDMPALRANGMEDAMVRRAWEYRDRSSYSVNSYTKPEITLETLARLLGEDTFLRVMRTYARRYRFAHPTTEDFIATVNEVTGADWRWYFEQTWYSSEQCDYAVEVRNRRIPPLQGWQESPGGRLVEAPKGGDKKGTPAGEVTVRRLGGVRLPVDMDVELADGSHRRERWDGQYRWARFEYDQEVRRADVDPEGKLALDVDRDNNTWRRDAGAGREVAARWSARYLLWLQAFLEMHTVLG